MVPLSFMRSVVLLVRESGREVHRHMYSIGGQAGPLGPIADGIELLHVDGSAGSLEATRLSLWGAPPRDRGPAVALGPAITAAVRRVNGLLALRRIEREGHVIAHGTQVLVVGDAGDPSLGQVLAIAREALSMDELPATVCYLLDSALPLRLTAAGPPGEAPARYLADFTFLFTDRTGFPAIAYVEAGVRRHVLAQAVFALIVTGIAMDPTFAQLVERRPAEGAVNLGSLRACLVVFPRAGVERYCAAGLGQDLVASWRRALAGGPGAPGAAAEQALAEQVRRETWDWLDDRVPRPGADPDRSTGSDAGFGGSGTRHWWPALDVLHTDGSGEGARAHRRLVEATERLFGLFGHPEVDEESRDHPDLTWADVACQRLGRAPDAGSGWERAAGAAWSPIPGLLLAHWRELFSRRSLNRGFAERCEEQLGRLQASMDRLRERHRMRYRARLADYRELGRLWLGRPAEPEASGPQGPHEEEEVEEAGHRLGHCEEEIVLALRERVRALRGRVPPRWGAGGAALGALGIVTPAALVLVRAGRFAASRTSLLELASVAAGCMLLGALGYVAVRRRRRRRALAAETDLLRFLCLCYAYRCERAEDRFRSGSLAPLRDWIREALDGAAAADELFGAVHEGLEEAMRDAERSLFDSPPATADLLVAEGRHLVRRGPEEAGRDGEITLDGVLRAVRRRWAAAATPQALVNAFLATLEGDRNPLEMDANELRDRVIAFVRTRLDDVVTAGAPADVHRAVREPWIQSRAARHLESPLYVQRGTMQPRQRYVCGRPPTDDLTGLPPGEVVLGRQRDWWLLGALFAESADSTLEDHLFDQLFPVRPAPP